MGDSFVDPVELDVPAVGLHVGPYGGERVEHARLERDRVEVVDEQQARDDLRRRRARPMSAPHAGSAGDRLHDPRQPLAVEVDDRRHELLGDLLRGAVLECVERLGEQLDLRERRRDPLESSAAIGLPAQLNPVGRC